jgi:Domain of unknown function (DUF4167)
MKRQRGRNNGHRGGGKPHLPQRVQTFDSAGPDVRIRGNAYQVLEKYLALARDATAVGDRIAAENFYQHAEHYYRLISETGGHQHQRPPQQQAQGGDQPQQQQQQQRQHQHQQPMHAQEGAQPQFQQAQPYDPGAGPQPITGPLPLVTQTGNGQPSD